MAPHSRPAGRLIGREGRRRINTEAADITGEQERDGDL